MHDGPDLPLVGPPPPLPEQECWATVGSGQNGPSRAQPGLHGRGGRDPEGHDPLLAALAEEPDRTPLKVHVVDVQADQLADAGPGRVEQLERSAIS